MLVANIHPAMIILTAISTPRWPVRSARRLGGGVGSNLAGSESLTWFDITRPRYHRLIWLPVHSCRSRSALATAEPVVQLVSSSVSSSGANLQVTFDHWIPEQSGLHPIALVPLRLRQP